MHSLFISLEEKSQNTFPEQADEALGSVIDNIIRNAIDHKKTDRIDITIDTQEIFCKVRIADHGIGIPDKIKKKSLKKSGMVEPAIPVWDCV